jgi:hypothetical protein
VRHVKAGGGGRQRGNRRQQRGQVEAGSAGEHTTPAQGEVVQRRAGTTADLTLTEVSYDWPT